MKIVFDSEEQMEEICNHGACPETFGYNNLPDEECWRSNGLGCVECWKRSGIEIEVKDVQS